MFVDAVVTDPPAGINFMGKQWDHDKKDPEAWISWLAERLEAAFSVLKPGGHALVWALPRTSHRTALAIEKAGFEIRDRHSHFFFTGFPKNHDVAKAIEAHVLHGRSDSKATSDGTARDRDGMHWSQFPKSKKSETSKILTTEEARAWEGWGSSMKPSAEDWWLARKPFKGTVARNVLEYGTGALNIDACRIATSDEWEPSTRRASDSIGTFKTRERTTEQHARGRWPAHISFEHHPDCEIVGTKIEKGHKGYPNGPGGKSVHWSPDSKRSEDCRTEMWEGIPDREVPAYACHPDCPVEVLDTQTRGARKAGGGGSRFFYVAKPSKKERNAGLGKGEENDHPTVKSQGLMRWLVRLITPPEGIVLDPFMGSGSTGVAAISEGFRFLGIDQDPHYVEISEKRIKAVLDR